MYCTGNGVAVDLALAIKWYRAAAEQGEPVSQCNLGLMYENGSGLPKDLSTAAEWYRRAADQGNEDARQALARLRAGR